MHQIGGHEFKSTKYALRIRGKEKIKLGNVLHIELLSHYSSLSV